MSLMDDDDSDSNEMTWIVATLTKKKHTKNINTFE